MIKKLTNFLKIGENVYFVTIKGGECVFYNKREGECNTHIFEERGVYFTLIIILFFVKLLLLLFLP